jgi:hypothetical protein
VRRSGFSQRAQTLRAAPLRSAMCTGSGFSQVHHSVVVDGVANVSSFVK